MAWARPHSELVFQKKKKKVPPSLSLSLSAVSSLHITACLRRHRRLAATAFQIFRGLIPIPTSSSPTKLASDSLPWRPPTTHAHRGCAGCPRGLPGRSARRPLGTLARRPSAPPARCLWAPPQPTPLTMERRDNFLQPPAAAAAPAAGGGKGLPVPATGDATNLTSSSSSTSSLTLSPPDFLRQVQAALKRHRPTGEWNLALHSPAVASA